MERYYFTGALLCGFCTAIFSCTETDSPVVNRGGPICTEIMTDSIVYDENQLEMFLDHISYTPESVVNRVLGEWKGTVPGTSDIEEFTFTLNIGSYLQDGQPVHRFYIPNENEGEETWVSCTEAGIDTYVECDFTSNSNYVGSYQSSKPRFLFVNGADLADGSGFPEELTGIPYIGIEPLGGEPDEDGYYHSMQIAFPPNGKMFVQFRKRDNVNVPNEADQTSNWIEVNLELSPNL